MTSVLTNTAAMSALSNLTATQRDLTKTQAQVSSGLAVATASDSAAYWSIGKTMSAQVAGLAAVQQSLALTNSIADVTAAALTSIKGSVQKIEADVVTANEAGTDETQVQSDITAQQQSIIAVANSASFNGVNWLVNHTLKSTSSDTVLSVDVSEAEFDNIMTGYDAGAVAHFDNTTTETDSATVGGIRYSQTTVSGNTATYTGTQGGAPVTVLGTKQRTQTGDDAISSLADVEVPSGISSDGSLLKSTFSLVPLTLFSSNVTTSSSQEEIYYDGVESSVGGYNEDPISASSESYSVNSSYTTGGILDNTFSTTKEIYTAPFTIPASTLNASTSVVGLSTSGGSVTTYNGSPSYSSPGGYSEQTSYRSVLDFSVVGMSASDLKTAGQALQTAFSRIVSASAVVGSLQNQISTQQTFNSALSDSLTSGIGSLVDADMNVASTRLQAEQTQQQLGIQALSVANQNSQLVLKLFQAA